MRFWRRQGRHLLFLARSEEESKDGLPVGITLSPHLIHVVEEGGVNANNGLWEGGCGKHANVFQAESDAFFFVQDHLNIREALVCQEVPQVLLRDVDIMLVNEVLQHSTHCDRTAARNLIYDEVVDVVENATQWAWPAWHRVHVIWVCFMALEEARNRTLGHAHDNPDVVLGDVRFRGLFCHRNYLLLPLHRPEGWFHACKGR